MLNMPKHFVAIALLLAGAAPLRAQTNWDRVATFDSAFVYYFSAVNDTVVMFYSDYGYVDSASQLRQSYLISVDGGVHWNRMGVPLEWPWRLDSIGHPLGTQRTWGGAPRSNLVYFWTVFGKDSVLLDLSSDGGTTWETRALDTSIWQPGRPIELVEFGISPFDDNVWYLIVDLSGQPSVLPYEMVYRTRDRGHTWENLTPTPYAWLLLTLDVRDSLLWYVSAYDPSGAGSSHWFKTTDDGRSWASVPGQVGFTGGPLMSRSSGIPAAGVLRVVTSFGYWQSIDNGATWKSKDWITNIDTTQWPSGAQYEINTYIPSSKDPKDAIIATDVIKEESRDSFSLFLVWIYHTTDDGLSWKLLWGPSENGMWINAWDQKTGYLYVSDYTTPPSKNRGGEPPITSRLWRTKILPSPSAAREPNEIPDEMSLGPIYPNPFISQVSIPFSVGHERDVRLTVSDVLGRTIAVLTSGYEGPGWHIVSWAPVGKVSPGMYFVRLQSGEIHSVFQVSRVKPAQ